MSLLRSILFSTVESLTYDDLIFLPEKVEFPVSDISLRTKLTRNISINIPFVSSPMDTVTESDLAIKLSLLGGAPIIHCNNTIQEQCVEIEKVKRFNNNFISKPVVVSTKDTIAKIRDLKEQWGFSDFPVTSDGTPNGVLEGLVSVKHTTFDDAETFIEDAMLTMDKVYWWECRSSDEMTTEKAFDIIKEKKIGKLLVIEPQGQLVGMYCRADLQARFQYPLASKDKNGHLIVGAAVTTHPRDKERIQKVIEAGVDFICIDSSNGCSTFQVETIQWIKREFQGVDVIAGNVVTFAQAKELMLAGADALRVGMGSGSICVTQEALGVGRGQASAVYDVYQATIEDSRRNQTSMSLAEFSESIGSNANSIGIPIIADGGISNSGHMAKAFILGASTVMMGSMFAGTDEAPGETIIKEGIKLKSYRGHGSKACHKKAAQSVNARYMNQKDKVFVPQGVSGQVLARGSIEKLVPLWAESVKHTFQHLSVKNMEDLVHKRKTVKGEKRTFQAQREGAIHDLFTYEK